MKLKTLVQLFSIASIVLACKKEINIKLKENDTKIVIEGGINNSNEPAEISITKTIAFNNSNSFPPVSGAQVYLSDNFGNSEKLNEISNGVYKGTSLIGVPGRTYNLKVIVEGNKYTAESTMPNIVRLDTVVGKKETFAGRILYNVYPVFKDPNGKGNNYRFIQYLNSKRMSGSSILNDDFLDGNYNVLPINNNINTVKNKDTLELIMQCIDLATYKYFLSMNNSNSGSAAPSNPVSNITGGALGYFSAYTVQKKFIIVNL